MLFLYLHALHLGGNLLPPAHPCLLRFPLPKVQRAVLFTRRNELVQDRDAGSVWPALADSFLLVGQPCRR